MSPNGRVVASVAVRGDPSVGPQSYLVYLRDTDAATLAPNDSASFDGLLPGLYPVRLVWSAPSLFPTGRPEWCHPINSTAQTAEIAAPGGRAEASFEVDCPPLVGSAVLKLVTGATGEKLPDSLTMNVDRTIGPPVHRIVRLSSNDSTTSILPVGIYQVRLLMPSNCKLKTSFFGPTNPQWVAVRVGSRPRGGFSIACR